MSHYWMRPSSIGVSQASAGTSRVKELQERLQSRIPESPARETEPLTWREQPVGCVMISKYKKNTNGAFHRRHSEEWTAVQREWWDVFKKAFWMEYFTQPRLRDGTVHLKIGDILIRALTRIQAHWQVGVLSFSGAARHQMLASLEMLEVGKIYTVTLLSLEANPGRS